MATPDLETISIPKIAFSEVSLYYLITSTLTPLKREGTFEIVS